MNFQRKKCFSKFLSWNYYLFLKEHLNQFNIKKEKFHKTRFKKIIISFKSLNKYILHHQHYLVLRHLSLKIITHTHIHTHTHTRTKSYE